VEEDHRKAVFQERVEGEESLGMGSAFEGDPRGSDLGRYRKLAVEEGEERLSLFVKLPECPRSIAVEQAQTVGELARGIEDREAHDAILVTPGSRTQRRRG